MKRKLLSFIFICVVCAAMTAASKAETDRLSLPFSENIPCPATVPYSQMERMTLDKDTVTRALEKHRLPPQAGETWDIQVGVCDNPDCALLFKERDSAAGGIACDYAGAPFRGEGECYDRASATVQSFLKEIGLIDYEYPFYVCHDAYRALYGSPWHPITAEEYMDADGQYAQKKWQRAEDATILVVVRFTLDGIPFGCASSWTPHTDAEGNGNPTPSAFFLVSEDGKICEAYIRNPVKAVQKRESGASLLAWQTVLDRNRSAIESAFLSGEHMDDQMTLQYVELVMLTDDRNNAFPAWNFVFEFYTGDNCYQTYCGDLPEACRVTQLGLLYNAFTGEQVW